jgi:two-component system response regulator MprA
MKRDGIISISEGREIMQQNLPRQDNPENLYKALIVDDEENIIELIRLGLRYEGFQVETASDGEQGVTLAQRLSPDVVILDVMMPGIDGLEVLRRLRSNPTTRDIPILMLTAKDEVSDRILGLQTGADDYVTKPFDFYELLERIRAILRRQRRQSAQMGDGDMNGQILQFEDLRMNTATREVTRGNRQIELTATEYNLLHLFMSHPRQVLDRQTILNRVWGYDFLGETNIIEVYVRYLREKIEDSPSSPRLIQTVRSVGYVLKG